MRSKDVFDAMVNTEDIDIRKVTSNWEEEDYIEFMQIAYGYISYAKRSETETKRKKWLRRSKE